MNQTLYVSGISIMNPLFYFGGPPPDGSVAVAYSFQFGSMYGGITPYTWSLDASSAALPPGLILSGNILSGTPTVQGSFSGIIFSIVDTFGQKLTLPCSININNVPQNPPMAGLVRWGKPDALGLADGTACSINSDQSGAGHDLTQTIGSSQPIYKANVVGGKGALLYDGNDDWMSCDSLASIVAPSANTPFTFACVFKLSDLAAHHCLFILSCISSGGSATQTHDLFFRSENNSFDSDHRDDQGYELACESGWTSDNGWHRLIYVFDGTNGTIYLDGVADGTSNQHVTGTYTNVNGFTEGAHRRCDGVTAFHNGFVSEDLVYTRALPLTDVQTLDAYLCGRYGLSGAISWDPLQASGSAMVGWFRSDTYQPGFPSVWSNRRVPSGRFSNDASTVQNPSLVQNVQNSKPMVLFNGTSQYCQPTAGMNGQYTFAGTNSPLTIAILAKSNDPAGTRCLWSIGAQGAPSSINAMICLEQSGGVYVFTRTDDAGHSLSISGGTVDGLVHLIECVFDGVNGSILVDGVQVASGNLSTGLGPCTPHLMAIGAKLLVSTATEHYFGYIGEVISFTKAFSADESSNLHSYDSSWWGTP